MLLPIICGPTWCVGLATVSNVRTEDCIVHITHLWNTHIILYSPAAMCVHHLSPSKAQWDPLWSFSLSSCWIARHALLNPWGREKRDTLTMVHHMEKVHWCLWQSITLQPHFELKSQSSCWTPNFCDLCDYVLHVTTNISASTYKFSYHKATEITASVKFHYCRYVGFCWILLDFVGFCYFFLLLSRMKLD